MPPARSSGAPGPPRWQIWVDTGGTFTDCLAREPGGGLRRAKVLSTSRLRGRVEPAGDGRLRLDLARRLPPDFLRGYGLALLGGEGGPPLPVVASRPADGSLELAGEAPTVPAAGAACELLSPEEAPLLAARLVTGRCLDEPLPPLRMRLATTRGTNALLERRGGPTALFITRGFADLLRIGSQQRPRLFALEIVKPAPLHAAVVEVDERLDASGEEVEPLDLEAAAAAAAELVAAGIDSAAVALVNGYLRPERERALAARLRAAGFRHVSCSAELAPFIGLLPRTETAVVDAYLAEVIDGYRERVQTPLGAGDLHLMTSAGGLVRAAAFRAKDSLLSGPAGGVVGALAAGRRSGLETIIAFDMGGTSTDVSRHEGELRYRFETRVGPVRLLAPALAIETVAAGGGSICTVSGGRLRVGPESAGSRPGPACYGAGGPLTLTDVNLLLGRIDPAWIEIPILAPRAAAAAEALRAELEATGERGLELQAMLSGCLEIANERMAEAVRRISIREGRDPADYTLVVFGGAGPQHACALAELLGIGRCLVPADAGLLSALGLGAARIERFAERQVLRPLAEVAGRVRRWVDELRARAAAELEEEGVRAAEVRVLRRVAELRLAGQDASLQVEAGEAPLAEAFGAAYRERYGYSPPRRPLELVSLRVVAAAAEPPAPGAAPAAERPAAPTGERSIWFRGGWVETPVFERPRLAPGDRFAGPALVVEAHTTTVVEPGWRGHIDGAAALRLERGGGAAG